MSEVSMIGRIRRIDRKVEPPAPTNPTRKFTRGDPKEPPVPNPKPPVSPPEQEPPTPSVPESAPKDPNAAPERKGYDERA